MTTCPATAPGTELVSTSDQRRPSDLLSGLGVWYIDGHAPMVDLAAASALLEKIMTAADRHCEERVAALREQVAAAEAKSEALQAELAKVTTDAAARASGAVVAPSDTLAAPAPPAESYQTRIEAWMTECFGPRISADTSERNHRFLEEALELAQAGGMPKEDALVLVDYVYGRPVGVLGQEVGGVMVTLAALCLANKLDLHQEAETELARIWTIVPAIRAKHATKPKGSPLPGVAPVLAP